MKILFFSPRFRPNIGGVEKHVYEISKILIDSGHDVVVVTQLSDDKLVRLEYKRNKKNNRATEISNSDYLIFRRIDKIKVYYFDFGRGNKLRKFRIWSRLLTIRDLIKGANIVHCHDVFIWYLPFLLLFPNKKVFVTFHGYEGYPISFKAVLIRKMSEILSRGNICVGDFIKKWYKTNPDYVIFGAANKVLKRERLYEKKRIPSALFVGRLDAQTNIIEYCKAVKIIRKTVPNFKFAVAGDGEFRSKAKKVGQVMGFLDNPEKLFSNYDFIFVSRYLSIIEALLAKKKIFAVYDNPVKEDYLRMSPFAKYISISGNSSDLAHEVLLSIQRPQKKYESKESYNWAKDQTWKGIVRVYLRLWNK